MLRRRLAALLLATIPVSCTAQIAPGTGSAPQGAPPAANAPAKPDSGAPVASSTGDSATPHSVDVLTTKAPQPSQPKITYSQCNVDGNYVAITFDDGPHGQNTPRLLDMLKQRNIKATFYLVGQCVKEYPQLVKRMVAEGHEVASHSWSHPLLTKLGDEGVRDQLQKTHDAIVQASGVAPTTMRPPYGGFTDRQKRWAHGEFGYKIILWDVDPLDWKVRSAAHVEREIVNRTVPGSIILAHDIHKSTVDAMPSTLDALTQKGFKFATVSELIAMDRPLPPKPKAAPKKAPGAPTVPEVPSAPATPVTETTSAPRLQVPATPPAPVAPAAAAAPTQAPVTTLR